MSSTVCSIALVEPRGLTWLFLSAGVMALALLLPGCAHEPRPQPLVDDIRIRGNRAARDGAIKKRLVTREPGFWPWSEKAEFSRYVWRRDLERIVRLYHALGFYRVRVADEVQLSPDRRSVDLHVNILEGPGFTLSALTVTGIAELPPRLRLGLLDEVPLEEGEIFREKDWNEAKRLLTLALRERGYPFAKVEGLAEVELQRATVLAALHAKPGPRLRFGAVEVNQRGAAPLPAHWIRDQVHLALDEGDWFSQEALDEARDRVLAMRVFATVDLRLGEPPAGGDEIPLVVTTALAPFRTLRLGGGVAVDQVRNEVHLIGEWHHRNFRGGLRRLNVRGLVGWVLVPDLFSLLSDEHEPTRNAPIFKLTNHFAQPRLFGARALDLELRAEGDRRFQEAFSDLTLRAGPFIAWRLRSDLVLRFGYEVEAAWISFIDRIDPLSVPTAVGCPDIDCFLWLSFLEQSITVDRRDDPLAPTRGFYASVILQEGGGPLGGTFDYFRYLADLRGYVSLPELPLTFAARVELGSLIPAGGDEDSPISQRFFAGGANSMRGFAFRRLSPLLAVLDEEGGGDPVAVVPIGGNSLLLASAEARLGLGERWLWALFVDTGSVTLESLGAAGWLRMQYAVGSGVRFVTPIGVLRFDLAVRLPIGEPRELIFAGRALPYQEPRSCFGFGFDGSAFISDGICAVHISFGEAF